MRPATAKNRRVAGRPTGRGAGPANTGTKATRRVRRGSTGAKSNGWIYWLGGVGVSIVLSLIIGLTHKGTDDADVRRQMHEVVRAFPNYANNATYYDALVDRCHHDAFEAAYTMSGRHSRAKIDVDRYLSQISGRMATLAESDGKTEVAALLHRFHDNAASP